MEEDRFAGVRSGRPVLSEWPRRRRADWRRDHVVVGAELLAVLELGPRPRATASGADAHEDQRGNEHRAGALALLARENNGSAESAPSDRPVCGQRSPVSCRRGTTRARAPSADRWHLRRHDTRCRRGSRRPACQGAFTGSAAASCWNRPARPPGHADNLDTRRPLDCVPPERRSNASPTNSGRSARPSDVGSGWGTLPCGSSPRATAFSIRSSNS